MVTRNTIQIASNTLAAISCQRGFLNTCHERVEFVDTSFIARRPVAVGVAIVAQSKMRRD